MSSVDDKEFNSVFVSYTHRADEDRDFAQKFCWELQGKFDELGEPVHVWMDEQLLNGKDWRRQIQRRLNSTSLVAVILSPDSIKSSWVLYEWNYSLLVQQSEPYLVHFRNCPDAELRRFTDYELGGALVLQAGQAKEVWTEKQHETDAILNDIASRLKGFSELRHYYNILTSDCKVEVQQGAADRLGVVPDGLKLAATNYLIEALEYWLDHRDSNGYVLASIASALGKLGKKKAIPILGELFIAQAGQADVLRVVARALNHLACEEPV